MAAKGRRVSILGFRKRIIGGREIAFDREGFFVKASDWSEDVAELLAHEYGLELLTEKHWQVIRFIRNYYQTQGRAPLSLDIKAGLGCSLMALESLFPGGIRKLGRLLAGLPNPRAC